MCAGGASDRRPATSTRCACARFCHRSAGPRRPRRPGRRRPPGRYPDVPGRHACAEAWQRPKEGTKLVVVHGVSVACKADGREGATVPAFARWADTSPAAVPVGRLAARAARTPRDRPETTATDRGSGDRSPGLTRPLQRYVGPQGDELSPKAAMMRSRSQSCPVATAAARRCSSSWFRPVPRALGR